MRRETFAASPAWRRRLHFGAVGGQGLGRSFISGSSRLGAEWSRPSGSRHVEVFIVMETSFFLALFSVSASQT
jgi:hypothetical protein